MRSVIHAVNRAVSVLTVLFILAASVFLFPKAAGVFPYIVKSGSMEPVVHTGAVAFVDRKDREPEIGDIITFRLGEGGKEDVLVTHRVVGTEEGGYVTKGDANEERDPFSVTREQVIGTYRYQIPKVGYFMAGLDEKTLTAVVFWIFFLNGTAFVLSLAEKDSSPEKGD